MVELEWRLAKVCLLARLGDSAPANES